MKLSANTTYYSNAFRLYLIMVWIYRGWRNNVLISYAPICHYVNSIIICSSCTEGLPKGPMASWVILQSKEQIMTISFKKSFTSFENVNKNLDLQESIPSTICRLDGSLPFIAGKITTNQCFHSLFVFMCLCDHCLAQFLGKIEMLQTRLWKRFILIFVCVCMYTWVWVPVKIRRGHLIP